MDQEFKAAKIIVENGSEFWVDRVIISACSDYFRALFTTKLNTTSVPGEYVTTSLEWVPEKIMKLIIDYAYGNELVIDADTVYDVYITVDYLIIEKAVKICAKYLIDHLTNKNCIETYDFGDEYLNQFIVKQSEQYILYHFSDISKENDDILEKPLEYVIKLLSSEHLYVLKEEEIWEFAIRWVKAHEAIRKDQLSIVMREIRFGIMDWDYFVKEIKNHPFVTNLYSCKEIISETEKFYNFMNTIPSTFDAIETPKLARPRIPHYVLFAIGGRQDNFVFTNAIEVYDSKADRWSQIPNDPAVPARANHGTVYLNNKIYMIGGSERLGVDYCKSCHSYDLKTDEWTSISPMIYRRCCFTVVVLNGLIYAIGGFDGHAIHSTAERYDPTINRWSLIGSMNVARMHADATVLNNQIFITGGYDGLNSAEVYDPEYDRWSMIPAMFSRRSGHSCIAYHGCIYALGGRDRQEELNSVERFDPELGCWMEMPPLNTARSCFTVQVIDDAIIVMGGTSEMSDIPHVELYDISQDRWRMATDMNMARAALSSCVVSNLPMDSLMMERWQRLRDLNYRNAAGLDSNANDNLS